MSDAIAPELAQAANVSAITQLILVERESRDLGRWDAMRDCFFPDSLIRLSWYSGDGAGFVTGSIDMARRGMLARHRLGPVLVRIHGDRAVASLGGIIDIPDQIDGLEVQLSSHARFLYRTERRKGRWGICGFDAIYLRDEVHASIPGETVRIPGEAVRNLRASYRMLSYLLSRKGYTANPDLPGEDRPELARALEREVFGWAGIDW